MLAILWQALDAQSFTLPFLRRPDRSTGPCPALLLPSESGTQ